MPCGWRKRKKVGLRALSALNSLQLPFRLKPHNNIADNLMWKWKNKIIFMLCMYECLCVVCCALWTDERKQKHCVCMLLWNEWPILMEALILFFYFLFVEQFYWYQVCCSLEKYNKCSRLFLVYRNNDNELNLLLLIIFILCSLILLLWMTVRYDMVFIYESSCFLYFRLASSATHGFGVPAIGWVRVWMP